MRILAESMRRLYDAGKVTMEQIKERVKNGIISSEEYEYITGDKYDG